MANSSPAPRWCWSTSTPTIWRSSGACPADRRRQGLDITIRATTDRRAGLTDADAVLTSFRPGGFEARALDERIPLKHGVIGQETQGPGGFFMALRSINVFTDIVADIEAVAPRAEIFNYTNPVNLVSQAVCAVHRRADLVDVRGAALLPVDGPAGRRLDPDGEGHDGRHQPQRLVLRAHLRRRGPDAAAGRGLGGAP